MMEQTTPVRSAKRALQHSTSTPSSTNSKKQKSPPTNIHYPCGDEMKEARDTFAFFKPPSLQPTHLIFGTTLLM